MRQDGCRAGSLKEPLSLAREGQPRNGREPGTRVQLDALARGRVMDATGETHHILIDTTVSGIDRGTSKKVIMAPHFLM